MTASEMQQEADLVHRSANSYLPTALGDCVTSLTDAISLGVKLEIARSKLEPNEFAVLQLFWKRDEWTATQIVEHLQFDPSRISRLVAKLVDRRLLRRRRERADRRVVMLTLTDKGKQLMIVLHENIETYESMLLEEVSNREMDGFLTTTHKIIGNRTQFEQSNRE